MFDINNWLEIKFDKVQKAPFPNVRINCPFCVDTKARFYIVTHSHKKAKRGDCYCHNEQKYYSIVDVYSMIENVSVAAAREVIFGNNNESPYGTAEQALDEYYSAVASSAEPIKSVTLPDKCFPLFGLTPEAWEANTPFYIKNRNLNQALCDQYKIMYCTGPYPWFNRVIIPIFEDGKMVAFQGRAMYETKVKKYLFSEGAQIGNYLYNWDNLDFENDSVFLVEGVFDVYSMVSKGYKNVVATFGKHITARCIEKILSHFEKIYIWWDSDAQEEIYSLAESLNYFVDVYTCKLKKKDPGASSQEEIDAAVQNAKQFSSITKYDFLLSQYGASL